MQPSIWSEFKKYLGDALPGGSLNPEATRQGVLDAAALATTPVPIVGDIVGLGSDAYRMVNNPEERTPLNYGLAALGAVPLVPSGMTRALPPEGGLQSLRRAAQSIWENVMRDPKDKLMFRGVKPVSESDLRSAVRKVRPNSLSGSEWWSDNPLIASSYGPFVRSSTLRRDPELVLSAGGRNWDDYFLMPSRIGLGYSVQAGLRPGQFKSGFESPDVRDIMVQHVQDAGPYSWPRYGNLEKEFEDMSGLPSTWSNNLLIKRGSDVLVPMLPALYARGGLAQLKECSCGR